VRSWSTIDGRLDPIDYSGDSFFRFPEELVEIVIANYSEEGGRVFDPFCGFGTTVVVAERLGRVGIGIERDAERAAFAKGRIRPPSQVIHADARSIPALELDPFDLIFTSPPYHTFRDWDGSFSPYYFDDLRSIFESLRDLVKETGVVVVEASNVREGTTVHPLAWDIARELSTVFAFHGETVRCNTGPAQAGPGYEHSYLLVFGHRGLPTRAPRPASCGRPGVGINRRTT